MPAPAAGRHGLTQVATAVELPLPLLWGLGRALGGLRAPLRAGGIARPGRLFELASLTLVPGLPALAAGFAPEHDSQMQFVDWFLVQHFASQGDDGIELVSAAAAQLLLNCEYAYLVGVSIGYAVSG